MLDVTDNLVDGAVVPPTDVVRHDGDDPYLVVAADKGTATFSDVANDLAAEYGYWLGDAFASGGSSGYDHKEMGITSRGAWISVRAHFRAMGVDADTAELTVVGIGDMSGDVFGNGMLRSQHLKLVGAFDHRHVFLDPDPDPEASFRERARLFALPALVVGRLRPRRHLDGRRCVPARREVAADLRGGAGACSRSTSRRRRPTTSSRPSCAHPSTCCGTAGSVRS